VIDFEVRHLTSTQFRLPSPRVYVSPLGDYFFYLSGWGDCSEMDKVMTHLTSFLLTQFNLTKKESEEEQLRSILINANDLLLSSSNKGLWKTVFELAAFKLNRNQISWAIAGEVAIYSQNTANQNKTGDLFLLNAEFEKNTLPYSNLAQESALPFFGLGLQSSFEIDSGHHELEPESTILLLNSKNSRQIHPNLINTDPIAALEQVSLLHPNTAAWASSFRLKF
jgi:hypothetical protein